MKTVYDPQSVMAPILVIRLNSAELIKTCGNSFLALNISYNRMLSSAIWSGRQRRDNRTIGGRNSELIGELASFLNWEAGIGLWRNRVSRDDRPAFHQRRSEKLGVRFSLLKNVQSHSRGVRKSVF